MSTPGDDDLALWGGDFVTLKESGTTGRRRFARYGLPAGSCPEMAWPPGPEDHALDLNLPFGLGRPGVTD